MNLLKDNGINCHLKDEHIVTIDPFLSPAVGGIKLMVLEADWNRAETVLDETEEAYIQSLPCPFCGAKTLEKRAHVKPSGWGKRIIARLRGVDESIFSAEVVCKSCHNKVNDLHQFS